MTPIPRARGLDSTLSLLAEGYRFISRRCDALRSDVFGTRLLLRPVLCMRGEEAARMFYLPGRFTRRQALPPLAPAPLREAGGATLLDGAAHRARKAMLMSLFSAQERQRLVDLAETQWRLRFARWPGMPDVVVQREAELVLGDAACQWLGIPPGAGERRNLHWARALVDAVRAGLAQPAFDSPLNVIARHRDADGNLASREDAAAELLGLLRSTVAVARFVTFGVLAMHEYPDFRARIAAGDEACLRTFTQEVRRYYPFVPTVGGCALHGFDWDDMHIAQGTWVLLDLYGTNHHPRLWSDPEVFRPERFADRDGNGFDFIPQGGGDPYAGHRCAGEGATIDLAASALRLFATAITYSVPPQDLSINPRRAPALPGSGMVIGRVTPAQAGVSPP